jgi:hypothetical protein
MLTGAAVNGYSCCIDGWRLLNAQQKSYHLDACPFYVEFQKIIALFFSGGFTARQNLPVCAVKAENRRKTERKIPA